MILLRFLAVGFILVCTGVVFSQPTLIDKERELAFHADVMVNAAEHRHRVKAMESFNTLFYEVLAMPGSFDFPFDSLKWISKKFPKDKSFKIYTWEVKVSEIAFKYFGVLQKRDGTNYILTDNFKNAESIVDEEFSSDNWLGALYYNLMEEQTASGQKYYLLFGLNKWNKFENIKLLDVLFFTAEGVPYFGLPVFKKKTAGQPDELYHRLAFKYASDAQMTLNYNPGMEMIMVDNLIRKMSRIAGQGETLVPDGSYVGYHLEDGYWNRVDKIATEIMESAPRPKPVLDARKGKSIIGN